MSLRPLACGLSAVAVLLACLLGAAPVRAEDPQGGGARNAPGGIALLDWERRNLEARWVAYAASLEAQPPAREEDWVRFLGARRETVLLEWIELTSRRSLALKELYRLGDPCWVRCAVWGLSSTDSHAMGGARAELSGARAGLVLDWLERHPTAATGPAAALLAELREKAPRRESAAALLPPYDLEILFAPLTWMSGVVDLGSALQAAPGARYVHQVERALSVLQQTRLYGEPWASRLAALVTHPHPRVRKAVALAFARRPAHEVPARALEARIADPKEAAQVREAAVLGLPAWSDPGSYAFLLHVALTPGHAAWRSATSRLADLDHGFALEAWGRLDRAQLGPDDAAFLGQQAERLRQSAAARTPSEWASQAPTLLVRAAAVAEAGLPEASALETWTLGALRERLANPELLTALEQQGRELPAGPLGPRVAALLQQLSPR